MKRLIAFISFARVGLCVACIPSAPVVLFFYNIYSYLRFGHIIKFRNKFEIVVGDEALVLMGLSFLPVCVCFGACVYIVQQSWIGFKAGEMTRFTTTGGC